MEKRILIERWLGSGAQSIAVYDEASVSSARQRVREMRTSQTAAEQLLRSRLRRKNIGAKFRRQHALYGFIVDFCGIETGLAIEVDGDSLEYDS